MGQKMPAIRINLESTPTTPAWYTVVTKFNYEKKFASDVMAGLKNSGLTDYILEVVVPFKETESTVKTKTGKDRKVTKVEKIYPLYVLVKAIMTEQVWDYLRNTTGCATILASGPNLLVMSDDDIKKIKLECGLDEKEKQLKKQKRVENIKSHNVNLKVGQNVKIIDGMFEGYMGIINTVDFNKNKVNVTVDGLKVELKIEDLDI